MSTSTFSPSAIEEEEDLLLFENNLHKISSPKTSESLFGSLSFGMYSTLSKARNLKETCCQFLSSLVQGNQDNPLKIPRRLRIFHNNDQLLSDYLEDSSHSRFDLLNVEVFSLAFLKSVHIYYIENELLRSIIINNQFEKAILLFKDKMWNFHCVVTKNFFEALKTANSVVHQIINDAVNQSITKILPAIYNPFKGTDSTFLFCINSEESILKSKLEANQTEIALLTLTHTSMETTKSFLQSTKLTESTRFFEKDQQISPVSPAKVQLQNSGFFFNRKTSNIFDFVSQKELKGNPALMEDSRDSQVSSERDPFYQPKFDEGQIKLVRPIFRQEETLTGIVKHFDEIKNYGFILIDTTLSEIFYHYEDVVKSKGVNREFLATCRNGNIIKVLFECVEYFGKYNLSRKAVNIRVLEDKQQILRKLEFSNI